MTCIAAGLRFDYVRSHASGSGTCIFANYFSVENEEGKWDYTAKDGSFRTNFPMRSSVPDDFSRREIVIRSGLGTEAV